MQTTTTEIKAEVVWKSGFSFIEKTDAGFRIYGSGACSSGYIGTKATLDEAKRALREFWDAESKYAKAHDC